MPTGGGPGGGSCREVDDCAGVVGEGGCCRGGAMWGGNPGGGRGVGIDVVGMAGGGSCGRSGGGGKPLGSRNGDGGGSWGEPVKCGGGRGDAVPIPADWDSPSRALPAGRKLGGAMPVIRSSCGRSNASTTFWLRVLFVFDFSYCCRAQLRIL